MHPAPPIDPDVDDMPTVGDSMSEVSSFMVSAATRTADATVAQSRLFLPLVPGSPLPGTPSEPTTSSLLQAGQGVSDGLAPVADSAKLRCSICSCATCRR